MDFHFAALFNGDMCLTLACISMMIGSWSELPIDLSTDQLNLFPHVLPQIVTSGVLSPPVPLFTLVGDPSFMTFISLSMIQSNSSSPLVSEGCISSQTAQCALKSPAINVSFPFGMISDASRRFCPANAWEVAGGSIG